MKMPPMRNEGSVICLASKYNSRKVINAEGAFDSTREYRRWKELCLLEKAGKITDLQRQVKFVLIPAQFEHYERFSEKTGKKLKDGRRCIEKECVYRADFVYQENGRQVVEDTKGFQTEAYIMKRKLMLLVYGIRIKET